MSEFAMISVSENTPAIIADFAGKINEIATFIGTKSLEYAYWYGAMSESASVRAIYLEKGYKTFSAYAEKELNLSKTTAYDVVNFGKHIMKYQYGEHGQKVRYITKFMYNATVKHTYRVNDEGVPEIVSTDTTGIENVTDFGYSAAMMIACAIEGKGAVTMQSVVHDIKKGFLRTDMTAAEIRDYLKAAKNGTTVETGKKAEKPEKGKEAGKAGKADEKPVCNHEVIDGKVVFTLSGKGINLTYAIPVDDLAKYRVTSVTHESIAEPETIESGDAE